MNNMINLSHLKFFCDAVALKSVSESAKKNFVTQSTISQGIAKLEIVLGVQLVTHSRKNFQVTEEGRIVYEQASYIFKAVRDLNNKISEGRQLVAGTIDFVCTNSLGMSFIAPAFKKMQMDFPQVNMRFKLGSLHFIRNSLHENRAEFAIVVYDKDFSQFNKHPLYKGHIHLYQSHESSSDHIEEGILIDDVEGMHVTNLRDHFKGRYGRELKIKAELNSWEVVARFTERNIGVGFFPDYITSGKRLPSIEIHPLDFPHFDYQICAIYNKGEKLSRASSAFIDQFSGYLK